MLRFKGPQDDAWTAIKATSNPLKLSSGAYEYEGIPPNGTCPVRILREVITNPEDGTESEQFAGDFGFMRNSFYEIEDDAEREKAVVENESKDMGDPCIVWSFGCTSVSLHSELMPSSWRNRYPYVLLITR